MRNFLKILQSYNIICVYLQKKLRYASKFYR